MSREHSPARAQGVTVQVDRLAPPEADLDYWNGLINEKTGGDFLGVKTRTMQAMRQRGGGPRYIVISSRCIRYRRIDLRAWSEARLRTSTSDPGQEAA